LLSDEILLAVREWKREGMGINLAKPGIENGNGNEPLGMGGNGIEKTFPLISTINA